MTASWIGARHPTNLVNGVSNLTAISPKLLAVPIDGYVRLRHGPQSHEVIALSATLQLAPSATGQIQLTVVTAARWVGVSG